jgi:ribosomal protein L40E
MQTFKCPKCNATLPEWAKTCQFCQADVSKAPRPLAPKSERPRIAAFETPKWIWTWYYIMSGYLIFSGAYGIFMAIRGTQQVFDGEAVGFSMFTYIAIAFAALNIVLGLGLMLKVELARGIVNFVLGINIIFGILGLIGSLGSIMLFGAFGLIGVIVQIIQIAANAFMIFLIGETDKQANF